uniref:Uncharacterized protein n=1 Tax=Arundo donax TaxID=35708 RepID=A0A0A9B2K2_ARUDO
MQLSETKKI